MDIDREENHSPAFYPTSERCSSPEMSAKEDRLVDGLSGTQFPASAGQVQWPSYGVKTYLPFFRGSAPYLDIETVKKMARAPDACKVACNPALAITLHTPPMFATIKEEKKFTDAVHKALSQGTIVVVKKWSPRVLREFTLDAFESAGFSGEQQIVCHDANRRVSHGPSDPFRYQTLSQFISRADDPTACDNCLDAYMPHPETPHWLGALTDESRAWHITQRVVIEKQGPTTDKKRSSYQLNTERVGQRLVLEDQVRTLNWVLACHGGFITHPHHDAAGYATFMIFNCGAKFWAIQEPKLTTKTPNRRELYAGFDELVSGDEGNNQMVGCLLLEQGDILIQPPNVFHSVYTPIKTITTGGHFYTYDTLHLTEIAQSYDASLSDGAPRENFATNNKHVAAPRHLARMVLALPFLCQKRSEYKIMACFSVADGQEEFYERPIFALFCIVSSHVDAAIQRRNSRIKMGDVEKETDQEYLSAKRIVDFTLDAMDLTLPRIKAELATFREHWTLPGREIDLNFLSSFC